MGLRVIEVTVVVLGPTIVEDRPNDFLRGLTGETKVDMRGR